MDIKKQEERIQLVKFLSNEKLKFLVSKIEDSETPDFKTLINNKSISIEHTKLIHPNLQQVEKYTDKIVLLAHEKFKQKYPDEKLYVLITFENIIFKGGKIAEENYVNEVFEIVEKVYLKNKEYSFDIETLRHKEKESDLIESFWISNNKNFENWQTFGAFLVDYIDINWLKSIINKKEKNLTKYKYDFEENWLLLMSDFGTRASANRIDHIDFSKIESEFDKIYIYNYRANEIEIIK